MPSSPLHEQIGRIVDKTRLLLIRNQALREEVHRLHAEIQEQKSQLLAKDNEIQSLRLELEYLRVASTVSPTAEQRRETAELLSGLVREIDRCIADLES